MGNKTYRSANLIIQSILEVLVHADHYHNPPEDMVVKSHLSQQVGLKASTADKYLSKMERAEYIEVKIMPWGEREVNFYKITPKGKQRYEWFVQINADLEE
jgi:predicted transcriptional regulator